jgi:hypothetical protein
LIALIFLGDDEMDVMGRIEIIWGMVVVFMVMKGRGEGRVQVGLSYEEGRVQVG